VGTVAQPKAERRITQNMTPYTIRSSLLPITLTVPILIHSHDHVNTSAAGDDRKLQIDPGGVSL